MGKSLDLFETLQQEAEGNPFIMEKNQARNALGPDDGHKKKKKEKKKNRKSKKVPEDVQVRDPSKENEDILIRFFNLLKEPERMLREIKENNEDLRELYVQFEGEASKSGKKRINKEIDDLSDMISVALDKIRDDLEFLGFFCVGVDCCS
eukprot:TRINITY_DN4235_c0_g1_i2.p1 TRINITY_DN4235_c0_g1~~TRINITY_DN4235_c0_g1_i2.p1  ORF type:complete len:163 (+),score=58.06 TRINITY_DN4235_c0_g1_i2:41-490(+)